MPLLCFMRFLILIILNIGFIFSCGNNPDENTDRFPSIDASKIFGEKGFEFPALSPPAKEQAVHWGILEDFLAEAQKMNGSSYQDLHNRSELLKQYSDSLLKKIPDTLNTKPIKSRLLVLQTRSAMLYQASHLPAVDSSKVQNAMDEMNTAITHLIVQLNEKFQKDNIDFQRREDEQHELEKQKRFQDSIINLELQDKKNKKM